MEWIGYLCAASIGIVMGLMGSGGSMMLPVLAYLFAKDANLTSAYSIFVIGLTSIIGTFGKVREDIIPYKVTFAFLIPALLSTWFARWALVPMVPEHLLEIGDFVLVKKQGLLILFAVILVFSGLSMITGFADKLKERSQAHFSWPSLIISAIVIGLLSGMLGTGGGFMIVPALIMTAGLEIKEAAAGALVIVAVKSLVGFFAGDAITMGDQIEWNFLAKVAGVMITGILLGNWLSNHLPAERIKRGFAYITLALAVFVLGKEMIWPLLAH
ncbi:sulfite exporter TauE/SafE family protein [Pontibacter sp. G13]|uniref:sulfite exporter TauE/SafE family protein n=1 Tax=Pontibacter sp. G13 TaxID=3074898 RepID=UPI00288C0A7D|nr:sulfite exporter TauE/SafE family protein [Pontibacter sp. G13]WNJ19335.1 sulfite exporter TauE/SafE family protein [Pontibacter sp. G13]